MQTRYHCANEDLVNDRREMSFGRFSYSLREFTRREQS
jgi:hypothetical protein